MDLDLDAALAEGIPGYLLVCSSPDRSERDDSFTDGSCSQAVHSFWMADYRDPGGGPGTWGDFSRCRVHRFVHSELGPALSVREVTLDEVLVLLVMGS